MQLVHRRAVCVDPSLRRSLELLCRALIVVQILTSGIRGNDFVQRVATGLMKAAEPERAKIPITNDEVCARIAGSPANTNRPLPAILASKKKDASTKGATSNFTAKKNTKNRLSVAFVADAKSSVKITFATIASAVLSSRVGANTASDCKALSPSRTQAGRLPSVTVGGASYAASL
jgi:hypothetical protein